MKRSDATEALRSWLRRAPRMRALAAFLRERFADANGIFIVGGALRDRFLSPVRRAKDVDVTLGAISLRRLRALPGAHANFFGGTTLPFDGLSVDLWPLEETYHIREFALPRSIDGFLAGAPFNLDKVAFELQTGALHERGCLAGLAARRIVYAPAHEYLEPIQALRCILLKWKTGFTLDDSARQLLRRTARSLEKDDSPISEMRRYLLFLKRFYGPTTFDRALAEIRGRRR